MCVCVCVCVVCVCVFTKGSIDYACSFGFATSPDFCVNVSTYAAAFPARGSMLIFFVDQATVWPSYVCRK
jgi:TRAP-type C4-dicarboxylate transport system permease small subunit